MRLAKTNDSGVVVNVIVVDEAPGYVPCEDHVGIGMPLNTPAPAPAIADQIERIVSASEFRDRFTTDEMDAVLTLAYGGDAIARRLLFKLQTQANISLDSPELIGGLAYLAQTGVVTQVRAVEVLS